MKKLIIGIDPAVGKSGVCVYDKKTESITDLLSLRLWEVFDFILKNKKDAVFHIENSNLVKGNWHGGTARGNVGKNKSISQNIIDFARENKCDILELKPKGYSKVFSSVKMFEKATGCKIRSNKDNRAAAAMVYFNK